MRATTNPRTAALAFAGIMGAMVLAASVAWACSPSAYISARPGAGPAGSNVVVSGSQFHPTGSGFRQVEIHWNSPSGLELGRFDGPSFSNSVRVPSTAAPAVYYLVAVQRNTNNDIVGRVAASFQVTVAGDTASSSSDETAESTSTSASGRSTRATSDPATATSTDSANTISSDPAVSQATASDAPATSTNTSAISGAKAQPAASPRAVSTNASTAPTSQTPAPTASEANSTPAPASSAEASAPSARSATADLWGGFATGDDSSRGPGLSDPIAASSGPSPLGVGLGMLSVGLVAMASGAAVANGRRRKVLASTTSR